MLARKVVWAIVVGFTLAGAVRAEEPINGRWAIDPRLLMRNSFVFLIAMAPPPFRGIC